jgi:3-dehydroquinate synthetase
MIKFTPSNLENIPHDFVVTDKTIARLYNIAGDDVFLVPKGEAAKRLSVIEKLIDAFLAAKLTRNSTVLAVGGGSIGDTVGFACSIYKRGVKLIHVPTTLLAMIDSSIGGKTAINYGCIKNLLGTFYAADSYIDPRFLHTLPSEQIMSAFGEVAKYQLLDRQIDQADKTDLYTLIGLCSAFKERITAADPFDNGIRRQLNMGHTVGHALELKYRLPHGIAVLYGLKREMQMSVRLGLIPHDFYQTWVENNSLTEDKYPLTEDCLDALLADKKNSDNKICFVLPMENYRYTEKYLSTEELKTLCLDCTGAMD